MVCIDSLHSPHFLGRSSSLEGSRRGLGGGARAKQTAFVSLCAKWQAGREKERQPFLSVTYRTSHREKRWPFLRLVCVQSSLLAPSARIAMDMFNVTQLVQHARPLAEQVLTTLLNEPAHLIVEAVLFIFVLVLLCKRSYVIPKDASSVPLSEAVRLRRFFAMCW